MKKKTLKILIVVFLVSIMLVTFSIVVRAEDGLGTSGLLNEEKKQSQNAVAVKTIDTGNLLIGAIQAVGTIVAIVIIVVLGIKYMKCSTEEKAAYEKTMIPYYILAILLFLGVTILRVIIIPF